MEKFRQLVLKEIPGLMRYATALTGNYENAENLIAICLEQAIKQVEQWQPEKSLKIWLLAIIHQLYMEPANGFRGLPQNQASSVGAESKFDKLSLQKLQTAVQSLPPLQKQVFLLVTLEEIPYKDVKEITDLSLTKIMALLHQSRKKLRQLSFSNSDKAKVTS